MTLKRIIAVALALLLLVGMAPELLPAAQAEASTNSCPNSSDGKHDWSEWRQTKTPTCTEKGQSMRVCYRCKKQETKEIPALGHNWSEWRTTKEASCTEKGVRKRECLRCDLQDRQEIDYAHQWGAWEPDLPGTCIQKERLVRKCKLCGALDYWTKDYGDHDWDEGVVTKQPTATQDGEMTYTCKNDPSHTKTEVIPATGGDEKPALSITMWAVDRKTYETKSEFKDGEDYAFVGTVTNTGNVDIELYDRDLIVSDGHSLIGLAMPSRYLLKPGETVKSWDVHSFLGVGGTARAKNVTPGTETETLAGTITETDTVRGYKPGTDEVICSATASASIGVLKPEDDGLHPGMSFTLTADPNEGEGKRVVGARVTFYAKKTNTGNCPIYTGWVSYDYGWSKAYDTSGPNGSTIVSGINDGKPVTMLNPGESLTWTYEEEIRDFHVQKGKFQKSLVGRYWYYDADKNILSKGVGSNDVVIPLTYPDGEEPEEAKPELTLTWDFDHIVHDGNTSSTTAPGILNPDDGAYAWATLKNTGNMDLKIDRYWKYGDGTSYSKTWATRLSPTKTSPCWGLGWQPLSGKLTPGTETEDLLGTVTITIWAVGYDPETGEELCKSNEITRTWRVGKDSLWEIPEDSKLEGRLEVRPGYESSDPAGYVLGEPVSTVLYVKNTGLVDLDSFTVNDPWDGSTFTDGPIAVSEEKSYLRADTTVQPEDVERGYIDYPAIQITWIDPDSEKERPTVAGPLHLNVLSKTGLLLKKDVAFQPANGEYFQEGEPIQWKLTVTNNSEDPVTEVTVEDKGVNVGSYAQIDPGDTENCTVPVYIVTEYDAKVVGYVLNSATATGTDYRGAVHTWPSNVAKAVTKKQIKPDEDPKGDPEGLHPAVTIVKAEAHGPLNGSFYEAGEPIDYVITIKNSGDTELKDIAITDSLAGLAPIATLSSLAVGDEKTFNYTYTVKEEDLPYQWVYNTAVITYVFGENVKGTPKSSNTVQSKVGDIDLPIPPHLDPDLTPTGDDFCTLTLDALGDAEANYTLHACEDHLGAAIAAEEAAESGDWAKAAQLWKSEVEALYEVLYAAADGQLKSALIAERAAYYDYIEGLEALSEQAAANELRLKCAFLCCALHTTPEDLPSSLAGEYARMVGWEEQAESGRVIGELTGSDSAVTETYAGFAAYAQKNVIDLMNSEKSWYWDDVFARGVQLWQVALDNSVNPVYKAADKDTRKLIAGWRISLDTLYTAEKDFMALLYEGNDEAIQEALMNLYKDAALTAGYLK